jgi:tRNA threonylcarbamoyladenosine biosynthesis protein TsaE
LSELALPDVLDTERLGAGLASSLRWSGTSALVLYLHGELGSGKTTLARGLLRELGVEGTVRSPTYTLVESYEPQGHRVLHVDLYRLGEGSDVASLGLRDELTPGALVLIEWPERAAGLLPEPDIRITLTVAGVGRKAMLASLTPTGIAWLGDLLAQVHPESKRV